MRDYDYSYLYQNDNVVYYRRKSNNPIWENLRSGGAQIITEYKKELNGLLTQDAEALMQIGTNLKNLGQQEYNKDLELLNSMGFQITDETDYKTFIENFNALLLGKERFESIKKNIDKAIEYNKKTGYNTLAPIVSSLFKEEFISVLGKKVNEYTDTHYKQMVQENYQEWENNFQQIIDNSIDEAMINILNNINTSNSKELKDYFGEKGEYENLVDIYTGINGISQDFKDTIKSKIDLDGIEKVIRNNAEELIKKRKNKKKRGGHTAIRSSIKGHAGVIGGSVYETIDVLFKNAAASSQDINGFTKSFTNEIQKIDNATLYSLDIDIDTQNILNAFDMTMNNTTNLEDAINKMELFYTETLSKLKDGFIVYSSNKAYGIGSIEKSGGFANGSENNIEFLLTLQDKLISDDEVEKLIKVLNNSLQGAILSNNQTSIIEALKLKIAEYAAYLMFDDWISIGSQITGTRAIHVFALEGLQVPLSLFLIATGNAILSSSKDLSGFIRTKITSENNKILYTNPNQYPTNSQGKPNATAAFIEQANAVHNNFKFSVHFMSNFTTEIMKWFN